MKVTIGLIVKSSIRCQDIDTSSDRILHVPEVPRVAVVTFATNASERPYNDYSLQIEALRKNAASFQLDFHVYTFRDLEKMVRKTPFEKYPHFRRGVGGWFWKPLIIIDFLERKEYDYVLYLDVDCYLLKNPMDVINSLPRDCNLAGFRMSAPIFDWTTSRVLNRLGAIEVASDNMWTAGILIVKNTKEAKSYLELWRQMMSNPRNLFDIPFEVDGNRHRHDQSLFSILIAQKKISIFNLGEGFYSQGIEATSRKVESAWIATGSDPRAVASIQNIGINSLFLKVKNQIHYRRIILSKTTFWIYYFLSAAFLRRR